MENKLLLNETERELQGMWFKVENLRLALSENDLTDLATELNKLSDKVYKTMEKVWKQNK